MSTDILDRAKRLLDGKFSPEPWEVESEPDDFDGYQIFHDDGQPGTLYVCSGFHQGKDDGRGDAYFVAAAPTLVRELIAEVEKIRGSIEQAAIAAHAVGNAVRERAFLDALILFERPAAQPDMDALDPTISQRVMDRQPEKFIASPD